MVKNLTPLPPPSTSIRNWPIFRKPPPLKCGRGRLFFSSSPTPSPWKIRDNQTIFHISKPKSEKCCNVSCLNDNLWLPKGMLDEWNEEIPFSILFNNEILNGRPLYTRKPPPSPDPPSSSIHNFMVNFQNPPSPVWTSLMYAPLSHGCNSCCTVSAKSLLQIFTQ